MARINFVLAQKSQEHYLFNEAAQRYQRALRWAPLSSEYLAGYGRFLTRLSQSEENPKETLNQAEKLYQKAIQLNPNWPDYHISLAQLYLKQFNLNRANHPLLARAVNSFQAAERTDPYGYQTNDAISYGLIKILKHLKGPTKIWALGKIETTLRRHYQAAEFFFMSIWEQTHDLGILKYFLEIAWEEELKNNPFLSRTKIKDFSNREWLGLTHDGEKFSGNELFWSGVIYKAIAIPPKATDITIQATGSICHGIWPYMVIYINEQRVGNAFVSHSEPRDYTFSLPPKRLSGLSQLRIYFTNDARNTSRREDRNLSVQGVSFKGL